MIHLIAVKTGHRMWKVISSDLLDKYPCATTMATTMPISILDKEIRRWIEEGFKKEGGSDG